MVSNAKKEIIELVKISLNEYANRENLRIRAIVIGKLLERHKLFNFKAKLDNLKYTHSQRGNNYTILIKVIENIHNNYKIEDLTFEILLSELNKWFSEIKKNKEIVPFLIIFPINLNFRDAIPIHLITHKNDIKIKIVSYHEFHSKYYGDIYNYKTRKFHHLTDKQQINIINEVTKSNYSYFILEIYGRNIYYAIKHGARTVDINSGIFSFTIYAYHRIIRIGGDPFIKRISQIDTPVVFVFKKDSSTLEIEDVLFSTYEAPKRAKEIRRDRVILFLSTIDNIAQIQNKTLQLMVMNAFKMYYEAIRKKDLSNIFLTFWNIMEYLLLNNPELKEKIFIKRFKAMYREDLDTLKEQKIMVDLLYNKRNLLVHESIDTIDEYDRDFIKTDVEFMIEYFLIIAKEINGVNALNFFYDNINKPLKTLDNEMKVLNYIKKQKPGNSTTYNT